MQTLIEMAKTARDELLRGVIETYAFNNAVLERMPFQNIAGNALAYNLETVLPGIAFRGVNEAYAESVGVVLPQTEKLKIMGGDADTDVALIDWYGMERRTYDIEAKARAASLYFGKVLIDGDEDSAVREFDGLNERIGTGTQRVYADNASGAAGANLSENSIERLVDTSDVKPDLLVMGKAIKRQVQYLFRSSTIMSIGEDAFGRRVTMYDGIPIGIIDKDNFGNTILGMDETEGSSTGVCGSIYAIKFGVNQYLAGLQTKAPSGRDLGEVSDKPVYRYRTEWLCGMAIFHPRCVARLSGITAITGVA